MKKTEATHIVFIPGLPQSVTLSTCLGVEPTIATLRARNPYYNGKPIIVEALESPRLAYPGDTPGCLESRRRVAEAATRDPQPSITVRLLDLLASKPEGMRFTDIQRAAFDMRTRSCHDTMPAGWWCTNLLGGMYSHRGLLHTFATKGSDGRWYRNSVPHGGKPYAAMEHTPKGYARELAHKY